METIKLDLIPGKKMPSLHASQYDDGRSYHIDLTENRVPYVLDGTETISLTVRKCDNTLVTMDIANTFADKSYIEFITTEQMTACAGFNYGEITLEKNGDKISSLNFYLQVESAPDEGGITSQSEINNLARQVHDIVVEELADYGAEDTGYDNTESGLEATNVQDAIDEVNTKINNIPSIDAYTKQESDSFLADEYDATQTYAVGDYRIHEGGLYVCNTDISTAEAWNASHWTLTDVATALGGKADVSAIPTKTSQLQNDSGFTQIDDTSEANNKAWSAEKTAGEFDELRSVENTDLLYEKPIHDNYFINDETGVGTTNAGFYSYEMIEIPSGFLRLYPYNNASASVDYIRSVCFYDENEDFISGISGSHTYVVNGINIPTGAKYVSCSLAKATSGYDGKHYLSTDISGQKLSIPLKSSVEIESNQILNPFFDDNNVRMPCINFQFDDGHDKDADIVDIFDAHQLRCGFALITTKSDYADWLRYQAKGYEILSHSTDVYGMDDASVDSDVIEAKLKNSKESLEAWGFNVNGFVTPNSTMADKFKPLLRKYYQFAETVYLGAYSGTGTPYQKPYDGIYNGFRVSLHSTTLANQKKAVDECIDNYGCLTFYGHGFELDAGGNLTTANLNELLTYIEAKIASGKCVCETPTKAITKFFNVRNDDVSQDWLTLTKEDVNLDSRFNVNAWRMSYSMKQRLVAFTIRINPKVDISGQINPIFVFPFTIDGDFLIQNETGRNCLIYDNGLLLQGSGTWTAETNYRFSGVLKIR